MNEWFEAEQRVERAHEYYESGRWEDALRELRAALRVNPYQGEWHFNMGLTLDAMGRHEEAVNCFKRALEFHGEDAEILNNLGVDCLRLHRPAEALRHFERAAALEPHDITSYCHRISAYSQLGEHEQAEVMYYMAIDLDEDNPRPYFNISISLLERGLTDRAIWCLNQVRRLDPHDHEVHARLGEAYWLKGQLDKARRYYLRQLRHDPGDAHTLMELGALLLEMDRASEAAEKFRRVTELEPAHVEAHFELAELSLRRDDLDAAQMGFDLVLRLAPTRQMVHQRLAAVALRRRRMEEARRHLRAEMAVTTTISDMNQAEDLARLLLDAHMPREATAVLRGMLAQSPNDPRLAHQLALALFMDERYEQGIRTCRRAIRADGHYTLAMQNLALAHMRLRQYRRARYWLRRAMNIDAEDTRLRQLSTRLLLATMRARFARLLRRRR